MGYISAAFQVLKWVWRTHPFSFAVAKFISLPSWMEGVIFHGLWSGFATNVAYNSLFHF